MLRKHGIDFYVAIIVGFPEEDEKTLGIVKDYAQFVREEGASWVSFFYPKPLPGTEDYKNYHLVPEERKWEISSHYWAFSTPVLEPQKMKLEELSQAVNEISIEVNGYGNSLVNPFI